MDITEIIGLGYQLLGFLQAVHNEIPKKVREPFNQTFEYKAITKIIKYLESN